jgi:acyl-CoA hydrolase
MDLDALAGVVAYKHTGDSVMTVTAAVDRITIKRSLSSICDLELSGQVTFATGRSSMEVSLQVAKVPEGGQKVKEEEILMTCAFTMVDLNKNSPFHSLLNDEGITRSHHQEAGRNKSTESRDFRRAPPLRARPSKLQRKESPCKNWSTEANT